MKRRRAAHSRGPFNENRVYPVYSEMAEKLAAAGAHIDCILSDLSRSDNAEMWNSVEVDRRGASKRTLSELVSSWPIDMSKSFFAASAENRLVAAQRLGVVTY